MELVAQNMEPPLEVFQDPARDAELAPFCYFLAARYTFKKYKFQFKSLRATDIFFSAQFVLGGDCNAPSLYPKPYGDSMTPADCDQDDASQQAVFFEGELVPHEGVSNILFADGHAGAFTDFDQSKMTWHPAKMQPW